MKIKVNKNEKIITKKTKKIRYKNKIKSKNKIDKKNEDKVLKILLVYFSLPLKKFKTQTKIKKRKK